MAPSLHKQERASSVELGDPQAYKLQLNKRGRPVRRGAGKKKSAADFVDSAILEEDDDPIDGPAVDDDGEPLKPVRSRKRKRSPSPPAPPLDPIIHDEDPDELSEGEPRNSFRRNADNCPVVLQINVPLGYHGPLFVKLNKNLLSALKEDGVDVRPPKGRPWNPPSSSVNTHVVGTGKQDLFAKLPPEIRNRIYDELFVAEGDLNFHCPANFQRSGQFLRTCKLVHSEGASALYGKNRFVFDRNKNMRGAFWERQNKEIGYKDIRQFLRMIGPQNLAFLRDIKITFEDASPAASEYQSHEARRYINDDHLIDCLRTLREAKLQRLTLNFSGRRMLLRSDSRFLSYLEMIKVDELRTNEPHRFYANKISPDLFEELKTLMVRKKKLYPEPKK